MLITIINIYIPPNHNQSQLPLIRLIPISTTQNRELQIMRKLDHQNIVKLTYFFYSSGDKKDEVYLNLVLEYVPETVYRVARHYSKSKQTIPILYIKVSDLSITSTTILTLFSLHSQPLRLLDPLTLVISLYTRHKSVTTLNTLVKLTYLILLYKP